MADLLLTPEKLDALRSRLRAFADDHAAADDPLAQQIVADTMALLADVETLRYRARVASLALDGRATTYET